MVEELVVLQKWESAVGGNHQEDGGGDLMFEDACLEGLSLLYWGQGLIYLKFHILKKWQPLQKVPT